MSENKETMAPISFTSTAKERERERENETEGKRKKKITKTKQNCEKETFLFSIRIFGRFHAR